MTTESIVRNAHNTWTTGSRSALRVPVAATPHGQGETPLVSRLLTVKEIAAACQLSEKAVRRAIDDGELAAVKLRSRLRVTPQDFEAWIERQRQQCAARTLPTPAQRLSRRAPAGTFRALARADAEPGISL